MSISKDDVLDSTGTSRSESTAAEIIIASKIASPSNLRSKSTTKNRWLFLQFLQISQFCQINNSFKVPIATATLNLNTNSETVHLCRPIYSDSTKRLTLKFQTADAGPSSFFFPCELPPSSPSCRKSTTAPSFARFLVVSLSLWSEVFYSPISTFI